MQYCALPDFCFFLRVSPLATSARNSRFLPFASFAALGRAEWGGRLLFAGTESDQSSPGVIEGAIGAAKAALAQLAQLDLRPAA